MSKFGLWLTCLVCVFCAMAAVATPTDTFTTMVSFNGSNGDLPIYGSLVQGFNGNFYGTTQNGGANNSGTVFEITAEGTLTTLYNFCSQTNCTDGTAPLAGLVQATNGNFYGTTAGGGANNDGTIFEITPAGKLTTLYSFCSQSGCIDGEYPQSGLVQATNGNFYGTTTWGGGNVSGTVFEITAKGKLTTLYSFCSQLECADGAGPDAGLVQATNGNFYGTTAGGGANNGGTVFEITPDGRRTTLYNFCSQSSCADGAYPYAGLVQATDGNFYGTTDGGGANRWGTVFQITPAGKLTTLYSFCSQSSCADGQQPFAGLVQATDGNFYGTTSGGGVNYSAGTIFEITAGGTLTTLYSFCSQSSCADGAYPYAGLVQATDGNFYGTTGGPGGVNRDGTVFSLATGLGPFIETLPTLGKVGASVKILGNNLTGATSLTFNGTSATFTVVSSTEIIATVPSGATTGSLDVTTPRTHLDQQRGLPGDADNCELVAHQRTCRHERGDYRPEFHRGDNYHLRRRQGEELHG
jgi:uncharacterized repeat protein (TIGR03803 family)